MPEKVALITGSSSGFGLLICVELAKAGFRVVASMRDVNRRERIDQTAGSLADRIDVRRLDVTETASIKPFVESVVHDYGRIDVLVNNAGFAMAGFAEDLKLEEIQRQFATNFFGAVAMTQAVLPTMRQQGSGHIIMVSSIGGLVGLAGLGSYEASKHALEGWSESIRLEVNPFGIKVVLVEPGSYETDIWTRNAVLGEKTQDPSSAYSARSQRLREFAGKTRKRDPIEVARLVVRIAQDPNPTLRYLVGPDAHVQLWMKRILPWKWFEKLMAKAF
jgi:NAD(P)-dependent dehydrogenase (short-subunit alcohol dehydrogenase family)